MRVEGDQTQCINVPCKVISIWCSTNCMHTLTTPWANTPFFFLKFYELNIKTLDTLRHNIRIKNNTVNEYFKMKRNNNTKTTTCESESGTGKSQTNNIPYTHVHRTNYTHKKTNKGIWAYFKHTLHRTRAETDQNLMKGEENGIEQESDKQHSIHASTQNKLYTQHEN